MPIDIEPETVNVDDLPGIWSPVQWDLTEEEHIQELDTQATASLLFAVDVPEALLRLLLNEYAIERAFQPPHGFDPEQQGEWDDELLTFQFQRPIQLVSVQRERDCLSIVYNFKELGEWSIEIQPDKVTIERL
jgi:hypothetical protein